MTNDVTGSDLVKVSGSVLQNTNGEKSKFNGMNAKKSLVGGSQPKKEKVIEPKLVLIELNLLEWGCGAALKFSEPLIVLDRAKAIKLFLFSILSSENDKTGKR